MTYDIAELGRTFIVKCLEAYQGNAFFLLVFAGAMICLLLWRDPQSRLLRRLLWPYFIILLCTVYNILIMQVFIEKMGLSSEYYRFFWLLPLGIVIPWACAKLVGERKTRMKKAVVFIVLAAVIILAGTPAWSRDLPLTSNPYRIPDDMIIACDVIKKDAEKERLDDIGVFFDFDLNLLITQYDPSFRVIIPYELMMDTVNSGGTVDDTDNIWMNSRIRLIEVMMLDRYWVPHEEFMSALNVTETAYVVYDIDGPCHDYLSGAGMAEIARTENYVIYKYGWYFDSLHRSRGYLELNF